MAQAPGNLLALSWLRRCPGHAAQWFTVITHVEFLLFKIKYSLLHLLEGGRERVREQLPGVRSLLPPNGSRGSHANHQSGLGVSSFTHWASWSIIKNYSCGQEGLMHSVLWRWADNLTLRSSLLKTPGIDCHACAASTFTCSAVSLALQSQLSSSLMSLWVIWRPSVTFG